MFVTCIHTCACMYTHAIVLSKIFRKIRCTCMGSPSLQTGTDKDVLTTGQTNLALCVCVCVCVCMCVVSEIIYKGIGNESREP